MDTKDLILLLHPVIAIVFVFPLLGMVANRAIQTRQHRLQIVAGERSKIPPTSGAEHAQLGKCLTGSFVGIVLLAFANDVFGNIIEKKVWQQALSKVLLISITFGIAIASFILLYQAKARLWRGGFATLSVISRSCLVVKMGCIAKQSSGIFLIITTELLLPY